MPLSYMTERAAALRRFEALYVSRVLRLARGNVSAAARIAGMQRANFRRLAKRAGILPRVSQ